MVSLVKPEAQYTWVLSKTSRRQPSFTFNAYHPWVDHPCPTARVTPKTVAHVRFPILASDTTAVRGLALYPLGIISASRNLSCHLHITSTTLLPSLLT